MEDNIHQRGLPEFFKKHSIVVHRLTFIYRGWRYKEAIGLIEWLRSNDYIINGIQVFLKKLFNMQYFGRSWYYHGDRKKSREENNETNFLAAKLFIESIHEKTDKELVYEILFESEKEMNEIEKDFYHKSIIDSGYNYEIEDALELIERCREMGKELHGVEVFKIEDPYIQPMDLMYFTGDEEGLDPSVYYERFHIKKNNDSGNWNKAVQFIKENARPGYYFQITHE